MDKPQGAALEAARLDLAQVLSGLFGRLHAGGLRPEDLRRPEDPPAVEVGAAADGPARWLAGREITDPDLLPFVHVDDAAALVLDIGAHSGYSAASLRNLPMTCGLHAFEPNPDYAPPLDAFAALDPGFRWSQVALSDRDGTAAAYGLEINGVALGGMSSIAGETLRDGMVPYLVDRATTVDWIPLLPRNAAKLSLTGFPTRRLDALIAAGAPGWPHGGRRIAAMKIDVEGHEAAVLDGALSAIRRHRPMLMVEAAGPAQRAIDRRLHGYRAFARHGDRLRPEPNPPGRRHHNVFYLHGDRLDEYRRLGLIARAPGGLGRIFTS